MSDQAVTPVAHRLIATGKAIWDDQGRVSGYQSECSCGWATPVHPVRFSQGGNVTWRNGVPASEGDPFHRVVGEAQAHLIQHTPEEGEE